MSPNHELVQYIENEAFKGRKVEDILADVRDAGWSDELIQEAVVALNEEHNVLQQLDLDPLHRRKVHKHTYLTIVFVAIMTLLIIFLAAGVIQYTSRADLLKFSDPNFTMRIPEDWSVDQSYRPGASISQFYSSEDMSSKDKNKAAIMSLHADADSDVAGRLLREGGSRMSIIKEESLQVGSMRYILIEFSGLNPDGSGVRVHGLHGYVVRGQIAMSAIISSSQEHWGRHEREARAILTSIVPECGRRSLTAELNRDGTIFLCGGEATTSTIELRPSALPARYTSSLSYNISNFRSFVDLETSQDDEEIPYQEVAR